MRGKKITILIVEDEVISALLLKKELAVNGVEVCCSVTSGEEAVIYAGKYQPDCILMDIHLSGMMDGITAAKKVLADFDTQVIFMTGYALDDIKEDAMKVEPLAFFEKPVNVDNLISMIHDKIT